VKVGATVRCGEARGSELSTRRGEASEGGADCELLGGGIMGSILSNGDACAGLGVDGFSGDVGSSARSSSVPICNVISCRHFFIDIISSSRLAFSAMANASRLASITMCRGTMKLSAVGALGGCSFSRSAHRADMGFVASTGWGVAGAAAFGARPGLLFSSDWRGLYGVVSDSCSCGSYMYVANSISDRLSPLSWENLTSSSVVRHGRAGIPLPVG
jgi:hypothetical protein